MRNKLTIRGAVALLLCLCCLCVPLMGMSAFASTEASAPKDWTYCDCTVKCTASAKNPDCPDCQRDSSGCIGKARTCICATKCTKDKKNSDCPACDMQLYACVGKVAEPAPVCDCTVKCKAGAVKDDCAVCKKDIAGCIGKAPEPTPICDCTVKCKSGAVKDDCAVCKKGIADCIGKVPEPMPICGCTVKCVAGAVNTACPICKTDMTECKGKTVTPPPVPTGNFAITIVAPSGWYTKAANAEIRVEDVNDTGWKKVEAKVERGGSWLDLTDDLADTDRAKVEITGNCTLYVTVTGKDGKATTKSRYIECFDRAAPTVKTGIAGKVLRVEAADELSGVEAIYIDGDRYTELTNGTLDVRLRDLEDDYDQISVQAIDYAGNKSKTVQMKNPNYKAPSSSKGEDKPTPTAPPCPTDKPKPPTTTTTPGGTTKPTTGSSSASKPEAADPKPFTPDGAGTVVDNATGEDGKEFFTIQTPSENIFYLVIDRQRTEENVYFLNTVTEADLLALAEVSEEPPAPTPELEPVPTPPTEEVQPEPPAEKGGNMGVLVVVALIVVVGGGAAYYFKIVRPKRQGNSSEELDEGEYPEEQDDSPPWDVEVEDTGEGNR